MLLKPNNEESKALNIAGLIILPTALLLLIPPIIGIYNMIPMFSFSAIPLLSLMIIGFILAQVGMKSADEYSRLSKVEDLKARLKELDLVILGDKEEKISNGYDVTISSFDLSINERKFFFGKAKEKVEKDLYKLKISKSRTYELTEKILYRLNIIWKKGGGKRWHLCVIFCFIRFR